MTVNRKLVGFPQPRRHCDFSFGENRGNLLEDTKCLLLFSLKTPQPVGSSPEDGVLYFGMSAFLFCQLLEGLKSNILFLFIIPN
jgi:hypothetical protein